MSKRKTAKKGCTKAGRNKLWCELYRMRGQREKNKARKAARHEARVNRQKDKNDGIRDTARFAGIV